MIQTRFNTLGIEKTLTKKCSFTLFDTSETTKLLDPSEVFIDDKSVAFQLAGHVITAKVDPKKTFKLRVTVVNYVSDKEWNYTYDTLNGQSIGLKPILKQCAITFNDADTKQPVTPTKVYVDDEETAFEVSGGKIKFDVPYEGTFDVTIESEGHLPVTLENQTYQTINNASIEPISALRVATFTVVDNEDRAKKFTNFKLKYNGVVTTYTVNADNSASLQVPAEANFTIQVYGVDGYVDGPVETLTYATLNKKQITLNAVSTESKAVFDCSWTYEDTSVYDFDTHMEINTGTSKKHVFYSNKVWNDDPTTSVTLNVDARGNPQTTGNAPPETIIVNKINDNYTYYYYVNDFDNKQKFESLNISLAITLNNQAVTPVFNIPEGAKNYNYWNVCAIKHGRLYRAEDYLESTVANAANTTWADSL